MLMNLLKSAHDLSVTSMPCVQTAQKLAFFLTYMIPFLHTQCIPFCKKITFFL